MGSLLHPNVVRLIGICLQPVALVMELLSCTLYDQLVDPLRLVSSVGKLLAFVEKRVAQSDIQRLLKKPAGGAVLTNKNFATRLPSKQEWIEVQRRIAMMAECTLNPEALDQCRIELERALLRYAEGPRTKLLYKELHAARDAISACVARDLDCVAPLSLPVRLKIAVDVASAMRYLHSLNPPLMHRDLKSPNILLTSTFRQACDLYTDRLFQKPLAKIADFGMACKVFGESLRAQEGSTIFGMNPTWVVRIFFIFLSFFLYSFVPLSLIFLTLLNS